MTDISKKISYLIESQVPDFVRADHPAFVNFLKAYYEWMEDSQTGKTLYSTRKILDYSDIDSTTTEFVKYFKNTFLPYFPEDVLADKSKLIKNITDFYKKKGSAESLKFLFRVLYDEDIDVVLPKQSILIASDGKWKQPRVLRISSSNIDNLDLESLRGRSIVGKTSQSSAIVEGVLVKLEEITNTRYLELYISNSNRAFLNEERIEITSIDANGNNVVLLNEKVIGLISNIRIDPLSPGLRYQTGDPVSIIGGIDPTSNIKVKAVASVGNVTSGQLISAFVINGGYGYRLSPNTIINVVPASGDDTGSGANIVVSQLNSANSITLNVYTNIISPVAQIVLNAADYTANLNGANANTTLIDALTLDEITLAPISGISIVSGGANYSKEPLLVAESYYDTTGGKRSIESLGIIAAVEIINGGLGYDSENDTITFSEINNGTGANITFTTDSSGTINSVSVIEGGSGYSNTGAIVQTDTGIGAQLKVFLQGQGAVFGQGVDSIGRIEDLVVQNRGSGYISKPAVSLRVMDIFFKETGDIIGPVAEQDYVYQGDILNPVFSGRVDSFNFSEKRVRVYDYQGKLDSSLQNLSFQSFNVEPISSITYGNGQALAEADFFDGIVKLNGFYLNTDGFLSSDKKLQDAKKYHNYSYVIIAEQTLDAYRDSLLEILHPAGLQYIADKTITSQIKLDDTVRSSIDLGAIRTGLVTIDPFGNTVMGFGTQFESISLNGGNNALLVYNYTNANRFGVEEITSIVSNTELTIEGSTKYAGDGRINTVLNSNVISIVGNTKPITLIPNDKLSFNSNGTIYTTTVEVVNDNLINISNTVMSTSNNLIYLVYPYVDNVVYRIVSTEFLPEIETQDLSGIFLLESGEVLLSETGEPILLEQENEP